MSTTASAHIEPFVSLKSEAADPFDGFLKGESTLVGSPRHWFHTYFPQREFTEDLDVLVVGCGSDRAAQIAATNPGSRITAIDTDREKLDQALTRKQMYSLSNLEVRELDPPEIGSLGRAFDLIFSSGELCYLEDPAEGLGLLRQALQPEGSLHLRLFGAHGRQAFGMIRRILTLLGVGSGRRNFEAGKRFLVALAGTDANGSAAPHLLAWANDPAIVEALLQPEEHAYDVAGIYELLEDNGLRLQRPFYQAHYQPDVTLLARSPELLAQVSALPERKRYAVTELYRGGMAAHELVVCRDDRPAHSYQINLDGREWLDYVPIRNPGLTIAQSDLPAGVVARLRWDAHQYPEISALLDSQQSRLFNAIDGSRNIRAVISESGGNAAEQATPDYAKNFFRSMWLLDYVWFQTAGAAASQNEAPARSASI